MTKSTSSLNVKVFYLWEKVELRIYHFLLLKFSLNNLSSLRVDFSLGLFRSWVEIECCCLMRTLIRTHSILLYCFNSINLILIIFYCQEPIQYPNLFIIFTFPVYFLNFASIIFFLLYYFKLLMQYSVIILVLWHY